LLFCALLACFISAPSPARSAAFKAASDASVTTVNSLKRDVQLREAVLAGTTPTPQRARVEVNAENEDGCLLHCTNKYNLSAKSNTRFD
jgi:hypothetical protein